MIDIILQNMGGGELVRKFARTDEEAAEVAIQLIRETGSLSSGDRIVIEGWEEDSE